MAKIETDLPSGIGGSVEKTSELINDGEFGNSRFVEESELPEIVEEIIEDLQINGDKHYEHDQAISSNIWTIIHPLNKKPAVSVLDTAGTEVEGRVTINDGLQVVIEFNFPFSGKAILN